VIIALAGCASVPARYPSQQGFVAIDSFCRAHNLEYNFDTVDDIIRIYSSDLETRLMLNSTVGYHNGNVFFMSQQPFYVQGQVFLPRDLESRLYGGEQANFGVPFMVNTVVIDPGHGGKDPGAVSSWSGREKDINLRVAKELESELKKRGFRVVMTRSRDMYLPLEDRVAVAKRYNADLFISIHSNANRSHYMSGVEVYYLTPTKLDSPGRSLQLARVNEGWQGKVNFSTRAILWDMVLTKSYSLSLESANIFYTTLRNMGYKVKPPKAANYHVLRNAYTPAILVELGYVSNPEEGRMLRQPKYQKQLAQSLASSIVYLNRRHTDDVAGRR
jgi:N-acetylmuramoyl-L-alanine amidase